MLGEQRKTAKHLKSSIQIIIIDKGSLQPVSTTSVTVTSPPPHGHPCASAGKVCTHPVTAEAFHLLQVSNVATSSSITGQFLQVPASEFAGIGK